MLYSLTLSFRSCLEAARMDRIYYGLLQTLDYTILCIHYILIRKAPDRSSPSSLPQRTLFYAPKVSSMPNGGSLWLCPLLRVRVQVGYR
jgi:hypothetical protein